MSEKKKYKDYFNEACAQLLAEKIVKVYPGFKNKQFVKNIKAQVEPLELKARVSLIAAELHQFLPDSYQKAVAILLNILGLELKSETGMYKESYWLMPVAQYIESFGLEEFDTSINAIYEITKRHTGEFAIRPYIEKYTKETMRILVQWASDDNVHVRRLASEGCRPRLPWAKKLQVFIEDPKPIITVLTPLRNDYSLFVKKSVANNLNDILKDNYEFAMSIIYKWAKNPKANTRWIIKHALRNQLKKGNPEALEIIDKINTIN